MLNPEVRLTEKEIEWFWNLVEKDGPISLIIGTKCWTWLGTKVTRGYGRFNYDSTRIDKPAKSVQASRVSYYLEFGEISRNLDIDHKCRNTGCVNPEHLEALTHRENVKRALSIKNKGQCKNGHAYNPKFDGTDGRYKCGECYDEQYLKRKGHVRKERDNFCKNGHELTPDNTDITNVGGRRCKTCRRVYIREYQRKKFNVTPDRFKKEKQDNKCYNGHELTPENIIITRGRILCRTCNKNNCRDYYYRNK